VKRKMTSRQAAELLSELLDVPVSAWMVREMLRRGELAGRKPFSRWYVSEAEVRRYAKARLEGGEQA